MQYKNRRNAYSNQEKARFPGVGQYDIPAIKPINISIADEGLELVRFDKCMRVSHPEKKIVHFFMDDYSFDRVWQDPRRYITVLGKFRAVVAPDFSIYTDYPLVVQIYNHFRKHWLAAFWQNAGIPVIPCIRWQEGNIDGFRWCLDGEPLHSAVCISTLGGIKGQWRKNDFVQSLQKSVDILKPSSIILVGDTFSELNDLEYNGKIEYIENDSLLKKRGNDMGMGSSGSRGGTADDINWEDHAPKGFALLNDDNVDEKMTVDKWERNLTDAEERAIYAYTSEYDPHDPSGKKEMWETINDTIEGKSNDSRGKQFAKDIESALDKGYLKQNTVLHGIYNSDLFNGASSVEDIKAMVGQTVKIKGFASMSSIPNSDKYQQWGDRIAIHVKTPQGKGIGAYIKHHSDYAWEREFLYNCGTCMRIDGAWKEWNGLVHVNLTYIGREV